MEQGFIQIKEFFSMVLKIYRVDIDYLNSSKKWKAMYEQEGIEGRNFCEKKANNSRGMS